MVNNQANLWIITRLAHANTRMSVYQRQYRGRTEHSIRCADQARESNTSTALSLPCRATIRLRCSDRAWRADRHHARRNLASPGGTRARLIFSTLRHLQQGRRPALPGLSPHAAPRPWLRACRPGSRYQAYSGLSRPPEHSAHRQVYYQQSGEVREAVALNKPTPKGKWQCRCRSAK
jgi:hypothetical protein